jgi:hypothetical protein
MKLASMRLDICKNASSLATEFMRAPLSLYALSVVIAILALWTSSARAQPPSPGPRALAQEQFICHLPGTPDRQIGIYRPGGAQRCRVDYTRDGRTRSLWSSGHDYQFCLRKALEIVGLLESVDFKCMPHARQADGAPPIR